MRGFPRWINTKVDVENLLQIFPEETKSYLKQCLDERFSWFMVKKVEAKDSVTLEENQKLLEQSETEDGVEKIEYWLMELREDQNAWIFQLGFTVEEVQAILA